MSRWGICAGIAALAWIPAAALAAEEGAPVALWPEGSPNIGTEKPGQGSGLVMHPATGDVATGAAIIVCPGGGYGMLAYEREGTAVAQWFAARGVTGFVLRYHHAPGNPHPAPLNDAQRALRTVRARAAEFGVQPDRIGILGFSAGGHLAATAGTQFDAGDADAADPVERVSSRPDFLVLMYPVITMTEPYTHTSSRKNLLGDSPGAEEIDALSAEKQVTAQTPPAFLVHTTADKAVPPENSLLFYQALRAAGVPAELHIYEQGVHGLDLGQSDPAFSTWPDLCMTWLRKRGIVTQ